jgi:hypothetical protein
MSVLGKVKTVLRMKGYQIFTRPYELNIVGIRSHQTRANRFDDELHVFFKTNSGSTEHYIFKVTTDPGTFWLNNPMKPKGTAILKEGQYINVYSIGLHRGKYKALIQTLGKVTVIRDYNRDAVLDFLNGKEETGWFGINLHRASKSGKTKYVENHSAGCQVFEDADDFDLFMELAERHKKLYGNKFSYTLIDYRAMKRASLKRWATGLGISVAVVAVFFPQVKMLLAEILNDNENE